MTADGEEGVEYEIDIVEHSCPFHDGGFKALSNFKIDILTEVRAGRYSGYLRLYSEDDLG